MLGLKTLKEYFCLESVRNLSNARLYELCKDYVEQQYDLEECEVANKINEVFYLNIMASSGHPYIEKSEAAWASKNPSDITLKQAREILKKLPGQLAIQRKNIYSEENHAK